MPRRNTRARTGARLRAIRTDHLASPPPLYVRICDDCGFVETSDEPALLGWRECPSCRLTAALFAPSDVAATVADVKPSTDPSFAPSSTRAIPPRYAVRAG